MNKAPLLFALAVAVALSSIGCVHHRVEVQPIELKVDVTMHPPDGDGGEDAAEKPADE